MLDTGKPAGQTVLKKQSLVGPARSGVVEHVWDALCLLNSSMENRLLIFCGRRTDADVLDEIESPSSEDSASEDEISSGVGSVLSSTV